ncbi:MAG: cysteine--tRNA ligase [Chloroflexi bacterium]|nr:cysteine--tRNA ligase [Chloroflexota bacterium]
MPSAGPMDLEGGMRLYNTLTRRVEEFRPLRPETVTMYTCGPTVYRFAHIGNLRSYLLADWLRRALEAQGLSVYHVKNITDVGHMRQEMLEQGGDKVILAALKEGKTPQQIAKLYTEAFHQDEARLNILPAHRFPRASQHIEPMIALTQRLLEKGYAYEVNGNVYYSIEKFPTYGALSGNTGEGLLQGVRAEADPQKRDPRDFTLWKGAEPGRSLRWPSPWGDGFPGWHIECSAMSVMYLGKQIDIHTGGVDNIFPHHEAEIAQCEGAYGMPFVSYWVHGQHLLADGIKMAKSQGNDYTLSDLESRGFEPAAFRYFCLTTHYRRRMNFTFTALRAAQQALLHLKDCVWDWTQDTGQEEPRSKEAESWRERFWRAVSNDLDLPRALAVLWELVASGLPAAEKLGLLLEFDRILGLDLARVPEAFQIPQQVMPLLQERQSLRNRYVFPQADGLRLQLGEAGYLVRDTTRGPRIRPKSLWERQRTSWPTVSSSKEVASSLGEPDTHQFTVVLSTTNHLSEVQRCLDSLASGQEEHDLEIIVVDNGSTDGTQDWFELAAAQNRHLQIIHADHVLGEAAAKNIAMKKSRSQFIVLLDSNVEVIGDVFTPIAQALEQPGVGVVGRWGLVSEDLHHFHEQESGAVDAMQGYLFAFPRRLLLRVGLMREGFRFYRNLDIDFSFQLRQHGYEIRAIPGLPVRRYEHTVWETLPPAVRDELSRQNFRRFQKKWGHRHDLLMAKPLPHHNHHS